MNQDELREEIAKIIPTNWCDPLLTGEKAVIGKPPYNCIDIEHLLLALKKRIMDIDLLSIPIGGEVIEECRSGYCQNIACRHKIIRPRLLKDCVEEEKS